MNIKSLISQTKILIDRELKSENYKINIFTFGLQFGLWDQMVLKRISDLPLSSDTVLGKSLNLLKP